MLRFIKKIIVSAMMFIGCDSLKCVSINDQKCKTIPAMMNINSNEPIFYPYSVLVNKAVATVMILITQTLNYVFLMLLKT